MNGLKSGLDIPKLQRGLEMSYGLDAVWLNEARASSGIHLLMPDGLITGVGWSEFSKHDHPAPDAHILTSYPEQPHNTYHKLHLSQTSPASAILTELDQYDYMEGSSASPYILDRRALTEEELKQRVIDFSLGCYVLGVSTGTAARRAQDISSVKAAREQGSEIIKKGDFLGVIDDTFLAAII